MQPCPSVQELVSDVRKLKHQAREAVVLMADCESRESKLIAAFKFVAKIDTATSDRVGAFYLQQVQAELFRDIPEVSKLADWLVRLVVACDRFLANVGEVQA